MPNTTNKKPSVRKPSTTKTTKTENKEYYGKTIFLNFGFNFNGSKIKNASYINLNNIFYNEKGKYEDKQKGFSKSETYLVATEILAKHLSKMCVEAQEEINKALKKIDKKLKKEGKNKKNIKINLSANLSDGSKGNIESIEW